MSRSELELQIGTITMHCTADEVATTLAALLSEMRHVIPFLRPDERELLRYIMKHESGSLTVHDVFPAFSRDSEGHKTLRRFRAAQFVRPAETGRWLPEEHIEVKPFARLMWNHLGEDEIFASVAEQSKPEPTQAPAPVEVSIAVPPPAPEPPAPVDVDQLAAALWEDDDVMDLRDVETS